MKIERFEDIEGWQIARQLTKAIYETTKAGGLCTRLWIERSNHAGIGFDDAQYR